MNREHKKMATITDCKIIQPLLSAYTDDELVPQQSEQVKSHLHSCAVCATIADDFQNTARLVATLPAPPALSKNFEALLARRIADECLAPKPVSPLGKWQAWWDDVATARPVRLSPAFAAIAASVVLIPAGYFATRTVNPPVVQTDATPGIAANLVASDPMLTELADEHIAFSAAQPLGDPAQAGFDTMPSEAN